MSFSEIKRQPDLNMDTIEQAIKDAHRMRSRWLHEAVSQLVVAAPQTPRTSAEPACQPTNA